MNREEKAKMEVKQNVLNQEQQKIERKWRLEQLTFDVDSLKEEIKFREEQISSGQIVEKEDKYIGGVKPVWLLTRNIIFQKLQVQRLEEQVKELKQLMENANTA